MSAIKRFFQKKFLDVKFKKAGKGHALSSDDNTNNSSRPPTRPPARPQSYQPHPRSGLTEQQERAAEAALRRTTAPRSGNASSQKSTSSSIKAQAKRELEEEKQAVEQARKKIATLSGPSEVELEAAQVVESFGGVMYYSELLPDLLLPKSKMEEKIKEYLESQIEEDAAMASALLIHTINKDQNKVKVCIDTLCIYINNLIKNPLEEKFRKIKVAHKAFNDRVASCNGGIQFLLCAGFELNKVETGEGAVEDFYVISEASASNSEHLSSLIDVLQNSEPIVPQLYRAITVFHCTSHASQRFGEIPDEFYGISKEEVRREQQARHDQVEKLGMLRTKAMRERDEIKELRKYRYTLLRIRLPGDIFLQAIFKSNETLQVLQDFIKDQLDHDWIPFSLKTASGQILEDWSKTLAELHLVPAVMINLSVDKHLLHEANQNMGNTPEHLLKPELESQLQQL